MIANGKSFQDKHMLYPIPQSEIDARKTAITHQTLLCHGSE
jgi:hypothetical protein